MSTTSATDVKQPREAGKQKSVLMRVIGYLQDQALENSSQRSFLRPPGLEPQQRIRHSQPKAALARYAPQKRLSDATTAVERRFGGMLDNEVALGLHQQSSSMSTREMRKVQYAQDNILQNYRVYIPERDPQSIQGDQYWIIFIHGGYFRDTKVDALSFVPALEILSADRSPNSRSGSLITKPESSTPSPASSKIALDREAGRLQGHIAGYASLNYRLAPHPEYPQDDNTEEYVRRNAKYPEQLRDVHAAIRHLQTRHHFTNNYILAGHSVGATLTFLAALKATGGQIDPPACIVGLNGIYNFPLLHEKYPDYETMTKGAMTPEQYKDASPACYPQSQYAEILPKQTMRVLLSHSRNDGLVDWGQLENMHNVLQADSQGPQLHVEIIETNGQHDAIWGEGKELARTLAHALQMITDY